MEDIPMWMMALCGEYGVSPGLVLEDMGRMPRDEDELGDFLEGRY
jgi:hypothetical protein